MTRILAAAALFGMLGASTAFADSTGNPNPDAATTAHPNAARETIPPVAPEDSLKPARGNDSRSLLPTSPTPTPRLGSTAAEIRVFRIALFVSELQHRLPLGAVTWAAK
jgi:hypothetical protein